MVNTNRKPQSGSGHEHPSGSSSRHSVRSTSTPTKEGAAMNLHHTTPPAATRKHPKSRHRPSDGIGPDSWWARCCLSTS
jgi:hypothetical protein